jgi:hypothetical protein
MLLLVGMFAGMAININDEEVQTNTRVQCKDKLLNYGVALKDVRIESVARVDASIIAKAIMESKGMQDDALMPAILRAERNGTIIPMHAVPGAPNDPAA